MFSGNHKISGRQLYRNYTAGFISLSALLPPLIMNRENMGGILFALMLLGLYLAGSAAVPRPQSVWVKLLCYANYWILGTMLVRLAGRLVQDFLLTDTSLWVILGWFYLVCYYNLYKGLECRIRVSEILFPFFLVLMLFLPALMYGEVEAERVWELELLLDGRQAAIGYELFCWLGAVQSLWHLNGQLQEEHSWRKGIFRIWLTGAVITVIWCLFLYCIYGNAGHTGLLFPLASAMTLAHFPGNVIGRLDALFVFAWMIGLFLLCSSLFAPLTDGEPDTRRKCVLSVLMAASFFLAVRPECVEWGQAVLYYVSTPLQILVLICCSLRKVRKKKPRIAAAALMLLPVLLLSGCSAQELEQQSRVTAIGVDDGTGGDYLLTFGFGTAEEEAEEPFSVQASSLEEAEKAYWETCQKHMDFNHLKNFYFCQEILHSEQFPKLLDEIQGHEAYSRGTLVYVTEGDAAEEAKKEEQPEEGSPVHRLLNAWYNGEACRLPTITEGGRYTGSIIWEY